jgi:hypothetical protein
MLAKTRDAPALIWPDIRPDGYPANPKAGYPVGAGYRISGRILCSKLKCFLRYKINSETILHESFNFYI